MFLPEGPLRLAIGISLVGVGYTLGSTRMELSALWAIGVAIAVIAIWLLLLANMQSRREQAGRVASERSIAEDVAREVDRARRSGRPLTLVRYPLGRTQHVGSRLSNNQMDGIQRAVRVPDRAWLDAGDLFLLMPESDRQSAVSALRRLRDHLPGLVGVEPMTAVFPDDGVTLGGLMLTLGLTTQPQHAWTGHSAKPLAQALRPRAGEFALAADAVESMPEDPRR